MKWVNEVRNEVLQCKILQFDLISWCGNFVERHSFLGVSGELAEV